MLLMTRRKRTAEAVEALRRGIKKLPEALRKSLTWDRRKERSQHEDFSVAADMPGYLRDPYSPWHRAAMQTPMDCRSITFPWNGIYRP